MSLNPSQRTNQPQVSRTILPDLNDAVVRMVFSCPLIFKASSLFPNPRSIVLAAVTINRISVTFTFHLLIL